MASSRIQRRKRYRTGWSVFLLDGRRWLLGTTVACCLLLGAMVATTNREIETALVQPVDRTHVAAHHHVRTFEDVPVERAATADVLLSGSWPEVRRAEVRNSFPLGLTANAVPTRRGPRRDVRRLPVTAASLSKNAVFANQPVSLSVSGFAPGKSLETSSEAASLTGTIEAFSE